jgi:hypothetical protein
MYRIVIKWFYSSIGPINHGISRYISGLELKKLRLYDLYGDEMLQFSNSL